MTAPSFPSPRQIWTLLDSTKGLSSQRIIHADPHTFWDGLTKETSTAWTVFGMTQTTEDTPAQGFVATVTSDASGMRLEWSPVPTWNKWSDIPKLVSMTRPQI